MPSLRLTAVALLALAATGCDSSFDVPESGTFVAEVRRNSERDLSGEATVYRNGGGVRLAPSGGFSSPALVSLEAPWGEGIGIRFFEVPRVRRYPVEPPTTSGAVVLVAASIGRDIYRSEGGHVTLTRVTDEAVEGEFSVEVECCSDPTALTPGKKARIHGRFVATPRGDSPPL